MDNYLNIFWAVVWACVLIGCVLGFFWRWAILFVAAFAVGMVVVFVKDYIHVKRLK